MNDFFQMVSQNLKRIYQNPKLIRSVYSQMEYLNYLNQNQSIKIQLGVSDFLFYLRWDSTINNKQFHNKEQLGATFNLNLEFLNQLRNYGHRSKFSKSKFIKKEFGCSI